MCPPYHLPKVWNFSETGSGDIGKVLSFFKPGPYLIHHHAPSQNQCSLSSMRFPMSLCQLTENFQICTLFSLTVALWLDSFSFNSSTSEGKGQPAKDSILLASSSMSQFQAVNSGTPESSFPKPFHLFTQNSVLAIC